LKKIFGILLSLALVVSLGAITAAPVAATTMPSVSPTSGTYDLDTEVDVTTTIKWGDATSLDITDIESNDLDAGEANDYVVYGSVPSDAMLVIKSSYLNTVLTYVGDSIILVLVFDVGICTFTITATGTSPAVSPASATWVFGSDTGVSTTIIWGPATPGTATCPYIDAIDPTYYDVLGDLLVIDADYMNDALTGIHGVGDYKTVVVSFDGGAYTAYFTIVATGDNPTCSPTSKSWVVGSGDVVTTTINFNSATSLTGIEDSNGYSLVAGTDPNDDYIRFGTLLVIKASYLDDPTVLDDADDTIALTLTFDLGTCLFTITGTGADVPTISPESATWELGNCDDDVTTTINWAGLSDHNITIEDVTVATASSPLSPPPTPIELVEDQDYDLTDNTITFFACLDAGNRTNSDWDGLECVLDADVHQTRVIEITFSDDTVVEFLISTTGFTAPSLSSTVVPYDLDMADDPLLQYVGALITWGDATDIEYISQLDEDGNPACNLTEGVSYMVAFNAAYGGWLVLFLKASYLQAPPKGTIIPTFPYIWPYCGAYLTEIGDEVKVTIHWEPMNELCGVGGEGTSYDDKFPATVVTLSAVGTSASISPSSGEFNIDDPGNVTVEVDWGPHATSIAAITTGLDTLTEDEDWSCPDGDEDNPSTLIIDASYLEDELEDVGDSIVLDVDFDTGEDGKLTITAVGTPLCFIATAAYGTPEAEEINIIREFRDVVLRPNSLGAELVSLYYETSPPIAEFISQNEALRTAVRVGFIDPIVAILNWSHGLWS